MGKRRKEGQHLERNRYEEDDDDNNEEEIEQENNLERVNLELILLIFNINYENLKNLNKTIKKEPLKPEEIASIKSRKKLIATRRVLTNGTGQTATSNFSVSLYYYIIKRILLSREFESFLKRGNNIDIKN